jgi:hypothetical protein
VVNEKAIYNERSQVHHYWEPSAVEYPNLVLFMIYDDGVAKNPNDLFPFRFPVPTAGQTAPYVITGITLAELARNIDARLADLADQTGGVHLAPGFTAQLTQTILRFNAMAAAGKDTDFHRGESPIQLDWGGGGRAGSKATMFPISGTGPYHCVLLCGGTLDTKGGPKINAKAQVIDPRGQPIAGLYGAGNCIASPAGQAYWSGGGTIGPALVYGYLAGLNASTEPVKIV